ASKLPKAQLFLSLAVFLFLTHASSAYANVYATNIKVNGSLTGVSVPTGGSANISYILNEPASGGAMIRILSGNTIVRSISIPAGAAGTLRGTNTVVWTGTGDNSTPLAPAPIPSPSPLRRQGMRAGPKSRMTMQMA